MPWIHCSPHTRWYLSKKQEYLCSVVKTEKKKNIYEVLFFPQFPWRWGSEHKFTHSNLITLRLTVPALTALVALEADLRRTSPVAVTISAHFNHTTGLLMMSFESTKCLKQGDLSLKWVTFFSIWPFLFKTSEFLHSWTNLETSDNLHHMCATWIWDKFNLGAEDWCKT